MTARETLRRAVDVWYPCERTDALSGQGVITRTTTLRACAARPRFLAAGQPALATDCRYRDTRGPRAGDADLVARDAGTVSPDSRGTRRHTHHTSRCHNHASGSRPRGRRGTAAHRGSATHGDLGSWATSRGCDPAWHAHRTHHAWTPERQPGTCCHHRSARYRRRLRHDPARRPRRRRRNAHQRDRPEHHHYPGHAATNACGHHCWRRRAHLGRDPLPLRPHSPSSRRSRSTRSMCSMRPASPTTTPLRPTRRRSPSLRAMARRPIVLVALPHDAALQALGAIGGSPPRGACAGIPPHGKACSPAPTWWSQRRHPPASPTRRWC